MQTYHEQRGVRTLATLIGLTAVSITAANLVGSAIAAGTFGLAEGTALAFLICTIGTGILAKVMGSLRRWGYAILFNVVFIVGTLLVIYGSVGGLHGATVKAESAADNANHVIDDLTAEKKRIDTRIANLAGEIGRFAGVRSTVEIKGLMDAIVGKGRDQVPAAVWRRTQSCAATETTKPESAAACKPIFDLRIENGKALERERLQSELAELEDKRSQTVAKLAAAGGRQIVPAKARGFAEFAGLFGFSTARVEFVMSRLDKVLIALFLELVGVFGLEFGLAGLFVRPPVQPVKEVKAETPAAAVPEAPRPVPPKGGGRRGRKLDPKVISFAEAFRAKTGRPPSGSEIQAAFREMAKSTAYDYAKRVA